MTRSTKAKAAKPKKEPVALSGATDPAVAEAHYAKMMEDWAELPQSMRDRIIKRTVAMNAASPAPRMACESVDNVVTIDKHPGDNATDYALGIAETFGTASMDLAQSRITELSRWFLSGSTPRGTNDDLNAGLAFVNGCQPKNPLEATLATQMVMTNSAALRALSIADRNLLHPEHAQSLGNLAVKLLRTFTAQAEALAKLQRGGEQVVKHIHLDNRGGQAIVTDSVVTGGSHEEEATQSHEQGACGPALLGSDPAGYGVPITGNAREEALSYPRRSQSGSA